MYREFYGFSQKPFDKTPNPAFLYRSSIHEEALARLQHGTEERELTVLTGEIGTGKTLLSRALIDLLDETYLPILLVNPRLSPNQFLRTLARRLGIDSPARSRSDLLDEVSGALFACHQRGQCPVIIIDEAQLIPSKATFDEIRLLTNFQLDDENLFSLILIGQPELRKRLRQSSFGALNQRVGIRYHLGSMGREDTGRYVSHRLRIAGGDAELITQEGIDVIYRYSRGLPRVINNIASNALLMGFSRESRRIGPDLVIDVAEDLGLETPPHGGSQEG